MKKFFALVLALVMALSLVACGDKKDDSGDVTAEHTDTTTVAVGAVILARDDVSSDDVYKFVADIFDNVYVEPHRQVEDDRAVQAAYATSFDDEGVA